MSSFLTRIQVLKQKHSNFSDLFCKDGGWQEYRLAFRQTITRTQF
ncbi:MAG: hypothetical protein AB8V97_00875 [Coxiella endosymbiont of Dermacentor nuttalli]